MKYHIFQKNGLTTNHQQKIAKVSSFGRHLQRCRAKKCCRGVIRYHPVKIDRETLADLRHPGVQKSGGEFQSRVDGSYHKNTWKELKWKIGRLKEDESHLHKRVWYGYALIKWALLNLCLLSLNENSEVVFLGRFPLRIVMNPSHRHLIYPPPAVICETLGSGTDGPKCGRATWHARFKMILPLPSSSIYIYTILYIGRYYGKHPN